MLSFKKKKTTHSSGQRGLIYACLHIITLCWEKLCSTARFAFCHFNQLYQVLSTHIRPNLIELSLIKFVDVQSMFGAIKSTLNVNVGSFWSISPSLSRTSLKITVHALGPTYKVILKDNVGIICCKSNVSLIESEKISSSVCYLFRFDQSMRVYPG